MRSIAAFLLALSYTQAANFELMVSALVPFQRNCAPTLVALKDGRILCAHNDWTNRGEIMDWDAAVVSARYSADQGRTGPAVRPEAEHLEAPPYGTAEPSPVGERPDRTHLLGTAFALRQPDLLPGVGRRGGTWSAPAPVATERAYYVMNNHRATQLRSGG